MKIRSIILLFLVSYICNNALSQPLQIGLSTHRGFIWKQSEGTGHLITHHPQGLKLSFYQQTNGKKSWHELYNFPKVGLNLRSFFTQQSELGNIWSLSPSIVFSLWKTSKQRIGMSSELGIAYCSNPFRPIGNNKNLLLGTTFNYLIQFGFTYERTIVKGLNFNAGLDIIHFSNANFRLPNLGLNMFYSHIGLSYKLNSNEETKIQSPDLLWDKGWSFSLLGSIGFNGAHPFDRKTYPSYHLISYASKRWSSKASFNFGIDYFHNLGTKKAEELDWNLRGKPKPDFRKIGITAGHEQWFGKAAAVFQLGIYIYQPYKAPNLFYSRIGLKYHFNDFMLGFMTVKFHKGQSEVAEWGVGFRLNRK